SDLIDHTDYHLRIRETLPLKPEDSRLRVRRRARRPATVAAPAPAAVPAGAAPAGLPVAPAVGAPMPEPARELPVGVAGHGAPLLVLYGSNFGTAEGLARAIAEDGAGRGFAVTAAPLDDFAAKLPREGAVVAVT